MLTEAAHLTGAGHAILAMLSIGALRIGLDLAEISVYRRNGRAVIPLLSPGP